MNRHGLTLIEMLAATVLLGLLAATVIPIQARWNGTLQRMQQRAAAEDALGVWLAKPPQGDLHTAPFVDHPGWRIERIPVRAMGGIPAPQRATGYHWERVVIRDDAGELLAETLVVQVAIP